MRRALTVAERAAAAVPPASGAVVMGTGIVSVGFAIDGRETLSRVLLALAAVAWLVLGLVVLTLVARLRPLLLGRARSPAAFTGIAGTTVLGTRLALLGWNREAAALLVVALACWLVLVPYVLARWQKPTVGVSFVLVVATESLGALGAALAVAFRAGWLALASLACVALGLAFYLFVVSAFDVRQLLVGRGDHWVCGGAIAIATLACAHTATAAGALASFRAAAGGLDTAALVLWGAAVAWFPLLLAAELVRRRTCYDTRRWSTVFPLGMYAVCSFTVARVDGIDGIASFARVSLWLAFAVWLLVVGGMLRRAAATLRAAAAS